MISLLRCFLFRCVAADNGDDNLAKSHGNWETPLFLNPHSQEKEPPCATIDVVHGMKELQYYVLELVRAQLQVSLHLDQVIRPKARSIFHQSSTIPCYDFMAILSQRQQSQCVFSYTATSPSLHATFINQSKRWIWHNCLSLFTVG